MRLLGMDYGRTKVGLALALEGSAEPLAVVVNNQLLVKKTKKIVRKYQIEKIVLGLPEGELVEEIERLGRVLSEEVGIGVDFEPETLTSSEAIDKMIQANKSRQFRREMEDAAAAALILESYLEKNA